MPGDSTDLVNGPDGLINWTCHMPRAQATVQFHGEKIAGLGYVESLTLSIPPSKLPFRTLRWGRHLSDRHWLVWIGWAVAAIGVGSGWTVRSSQQLRSSTALRHA
jgi:hypothetical protein